MPFPGAQSLLYETQPSDSTQSLRIRTENARYMNPKSAKIITKIEHCNQ